MLNLRLHEALQQGDNGGCKTASMRIVINITIRVVRFGSFQYAQKKKTIKKIKVKRIFFNLRDGILGLKNYAMSVQNLSQLSEWNFNSKNCL